MKPATRFLVQIVKTWQSKKPVEVPPIVQSKNKKTELKLMLAELEATLHSAIKSGKVSREKLDLMKSKIDFLRKKIKYPLP